MEMDEKVIIGAKFRAGGAKIHNINEAITNYMAFIDMANGEAWWVKEEKREAIKPQSEKKALEWEAYLRAFVLTGEFPAVKPKVII